MTRMNRRLFILGLMGLIAAAPGYALAGSAKAEIVDMVEAAAAAIEEHGLTNAPKRTDAETWTRLSKGLYVFVLDRSGTLYIHPTENLVGQDVSDFKDIKGAYFVREILSTAKRQGGPVWTEYYWNDPSVDKVRRKRVYSVAIDELIVSGGYYIDEP